jgi:hypothetical protein
MATPLILKRAPVGDNQDDYSVLEEGVVVGRIFKAQVAPEGRPWMWASGHNGDIRRAAHGYEPTREAAMSAFAKRAGEARAGRGRRPRMFGRTAPHPAPFGDAGRPASEEFQSQLEFPYHY